MVNKIGAMGDTPVSGELDVVRFPGLHRQAKEDCHKPYIHPLVLADILPVIPRRLFLYP